MGSNDDFISLTLRLENSAYRKFHAITTERGNDKTWVLRKLVDLYNQNPSIVHVFEVARKTAKA